MSDNDKKYCPFLNSLCIKNKCMLYVDKINKQIMATSGIVDRTSTDYCSFKLMAETFFQSFTR